MTKLQEALGRIHEKESISLDEAASSKWIDLLSAAIEKNATKSEFQKASQALEDWAEKFPRTVHRIMSRGDLATNLLDGLITALDIRSEIDS